MGEAAWDSPLSQELVDAKRSFRQWLERCHSENRLYITPSSHALRRLQARDGERSQQTVAAADRLLQHEFCLLGSRPYVPIDPDRAETHDGYQPIDWYWDPVAQLRFPRGIPHQEWDLYAMRPGNADVKLVWELGRCQHWVTLGQAYCLSEDARYGRELAHQLDDFMQANPVGIGIQWTCTMDVAIRALNWALALSLMRSCSAVSVDFWRRAYDALFAHGQFIFHNLENTYEVTSNHFLSNIVGLYYLASVFQDLPQGAEWDVFCREQLEREIECQVLDDGADYESSVPYHRLVLELFLGAARLGVWHNKPLSEAYHARLHKMLEFLAGILRPDGKMPQIGDADDGRLHICTDYGTWLPQDGRHVLAPAAYLLNEARWLSQAGPGGEWEAAWWGFEGTSMPNGSDAGLDTGPAALPTVATVFPQAGLVSVRQETAYLLISNGIVGTKGFGNHKHNDQLSFEYHGHGIPLLVDPGSYVYTGDPESRNVFRSTAYHNTLGIDGEEQNEMNPEWLFRLFETAKAEHLGFQQTDTSVEYYGRHVGYERLKNPVIHERGFHLEKATGGLRVVDRLHGHGSHQLRWHFHCAPGVEVCQQANQYILSAETRQFVLLVPDGLTGNISQGWYSPSYGVRQSCQMIELGLEITLTGEEVWYFAVGPQDWIAHADHHAIWTAVAAELRSSAPQSLGA